jgi:nucleoid-associated protein YgaU
MSPPGSAGEVVVHGGDTLWSIAQRSLPPGASPVTITAEWRRWYATNRSTIGADPALIFPGQRLRPPAAGRSGNPAQHPADSRSIR